MEGNEIERLAELERFLIMDSSPEREFDELTELMARIAEVPICLISLVDEHRQWFKSKVGLEVKETPRSWSFCQYTIQQDNILEINDASIHPLVRNSPLVTGPPNIRFYAGAPLVTSSGYKLGSLCVIDSKPSSLNAVQRQALSTLAAQASKQMESRLMMKKYARSLRESHEQRQQLNEMNQAKGKLLSIISHDFRSPLSQLKNFTTLLKLGVLTPDEHEKILNGIDEHLLHTLSLIDNLLLWSKQQMGGFKIQPTNFNVSDVVEEILALFHQQFLDKQVKVSSNISTSLSLIADEQMVKIILRNLISNAIKFTKKGDSIILDSSIQKGFIEIRVMDTGVGMSKEMLDQIFNSDMNDSTPGTNYEKGTGLGLSLSRMFARYNQGDVELLSKEQEGTTAILRLPLEPC